MRALALVVLMLPAAAGLAQSSPPLPSRLSGSWTLTTPRGTVIDVFEIEFDGDRAAPAISGRLTWRGFNCGASREPVGATWNGSELRFQAVMRPNVNTQRMNGTCTDEPVQFVLRRKGPGDSFEGDARVGSTVVTMTAAP